MVFIELRLRLKLLMLMEKEVATEQVCCWEEEVESKALLEV